jgi:hypothetical protein
MEVNIKNIIKKIKLSLNSILKVFYYKMIFKEKQLKILYQNLIKLL